MSANAKETGVMIDVGRKYFRPKELCALIDCMAELDMNRLMLHFSEDAGLGLDCPAYPWLAGRDGELSPQATDGIVDERYLSLTEASRLVEYANSKGILVIPSFDSPGHLNYTVKKFNDRVAALGAVEYEYDGDAYRAEYNGRYSFYKNGELLAFPEGTVDLYGIGSYYYIDGKSGKVKGSRNDTVSRGFDMSNPAAEAFIRSVIESYAVFFRGLGCEAVDIGCDELLGFGTAVLPLEEHTRWEQLGTWKAAAIEKTGLETAVAYDLFVLYANSLKASMEKLGYTSVRIWNDEFRRTFDTGWTADPAVHVQFDTDFIVQYWSTRRVYESPASLAANGYQIINVDSVHSYYVLLEGARKPEPDAYKCVTPECIRSEWNPYLFGELKNGVPANGYALTTPEERSMISGAYFCDWNDCSTLRTGEEVIDELKPLLKAWRSVAEYD